MGALFRVGFALGLMGSVFSVSGPAHAGPQPSKICTVLNQALDLEEEFFLSPNADYAPIETGAISVAKELGFYEPYRTECSEKQLREARRVVDYVLGRVYLRQYEITRKKYYLSDAINHFTQANRGGLFGGTTFLLGLAKVRYGWLMPPTKRAWKYEYEGLTTMLDAISGRFSYQQRKLLKRVEKPFRFNGRVVGSVAVEGAREQLGPAWKKVRQAYRQVAVTKASLGSDATKCGREREQLDSITQKLRAAGRAGMTRKLMQEVQKLQGKIASYQSRCAEVEALMGNSAADEAQGKAFIQLMDSIRDFEEPIEYLYWSTKLFQALAISATRHHGIKNNDRFRRIDQIVPLARVLADQLSLIENSNPTIFRPLSAEEDTLVKGMGKTWSCGEKGSLETNVRLCQATGNQARGLLLASYYNNQNFLAGAFRFMGLTLRKRWESQLMAAENEPLRESVFEAVRNALGMALKFVGQADVKTLYENEDNGLEVDRSPEEMLQYNALAEAEIHLNIAEFESKYSLTFSIITVVDKKQTIKKMDRPGDPQRYTGIANSALGHLRRAVDKISSVQPAYIETNENGKCVEVDSEEQSRSVQQLIGRIRFRYGSALENAMRKNLQAGDYGTVLSMSDAVRVPFDFIERLDAYYYLAEAALMDPGTSANIAAQYAAAGISAFVEQGSKSMTVWRGTDAMDTSKNEPCQVFSLDLRKALVVQQITSGFGELVKSRCSVLAQLMRVIKENASESTFEMNKQGLLQIEGLDWSKKPWDDDVQCEGQNEVRCKEARGRCATFYEEYLQ